MMTTRIARMEPMTTMPPIVTACRATRSKSLRRAKRVENTCSGALTGRAAATSFVETAISRSIDLLGVLFEDRHRQRIVAVLENFLLPLFGEHHLQEFTRQRFERLVGRLVDVDVEKAGNRIFPRVGVLGGRRDASAPLLLRQIERLHPGGGVADAAVADAETVDRDALDDRGRAWLLLHLVLEVAVAEHVLLEKAIRAGGGIAAV